MDGLLKDSFYKDSTFAIVNPKNIFKGDAFQAFVYFIECINGRRDVLEDIRRARHHHSYDTRQKALIEHACLVWCDMAIASDYAVFKYGENEVRVYSDCATFHTPRIEIRLTHKEFRLWAKRYLEFKVSA
jgi:hypothetical protein|nr:MAG TPA: hypothetical protein [Caudoviricetes sp.]